MVSKRTIFIAGSLGIGAAAALTAAAAGGALTAYAMTRKRRRPADLRGQVVLITGGSRGLGLELARQFRDLGCRIAICGRDEQQLERARHHLLGSTRGGTQADIFARRCDVSNREQVTGLVQEVTQHFGRIDILVANAGIISVGPIDTMKIEDFEQAMSVMFWGVLHPIWTVLPQMIERGSGRIVTITSIGGKVSVPHLVPYSCAKFAAVALSEGLRTELKPKGIDVLTIVPGLMRTGSHLNAWFKGKHEREFSWFGLAASTPGVSIDARRAARQIVSALRSGRSERILTMQANLLARLHGAFPEATNWALQLVNRLLPGAENASGEQIRGADAEARMNSRLYRAVTGLGRSAAREMLEV